MPVTQKVFKKIEPFLYLIPSALILIMFTYYPFGKSFLQSFFIVDNFGKAKEFVALENYAAVLGNSRFIRAIGNTLIYVIVTVPISISGGLLLALLAQKRTRTSTIYEAMYALPMAMSMSVVAMIYQLALNPNLGVINKFFQTTTNWLREEKTAFLWLMIIQVWLNIGFDFLFTLSALRGISDEVLESAELDGAIGFKKLTKIILPLVSPTILFLLVSSIAKAMIAGGLTMILTQGGPNGSTETIVSFLYNQAVVSGKYNTGYAATIVGFILSFMLVLLSFIYEKKGVYYD